MITFNLNQNITIISDADNTIFYIDNSGDLHRTDGPALIKQNGVRKWYQRGLLHRIDGPAVIEARGYQFWLFGKQLTEDEFFKQSFNLIYTTKAN